MRSTLLVIDDDAEFFAQLQAAFAAYELVHAKNSRQAGILLAHQPFDLILLDLNLDERREELEGLRYLRTIREKHPLVPIFVLSKHAGYQEVSEAMRNGALGFFNKNEQLLLDWRNKVQQAVANKRMLEDRYPFVGESEGVMRLKASLRPAHRLPDKPLLLFGEPGSGKQTAARYFHHQSDNRYAEFVPCDLPALESAEQLADLLRQARRGTLYAHRLHQASPQQQEWLLDACRALRGAGQLFRWNGQLVASAQEDLAPKAATVAFLPELYFELLPVPVPPLRERPGDIHLLLKFFLQERGFRNPDQLLTLDAKKYLLNFDYPLNIRQLKHAVETMLLQRERLGTQLVEVACLPAELIGKNHTASGFELHELDKALAFTELEFIEQALRQALGVRGQAAELLGIKNDDNLRNRILKHHRQFPDLVAQFPKIAESYPRIVKKRP
jgi:two-component system nitrogen regulation response regulator NtrX